MSRPEFYRRTAQRLRVGRRSGSLSSIVKCLIFAGAVGCGNQDPEGAAMLWSRLQAMNYRALPRAPGFAQRTPSTGIHAADVDLYINDVFVETIASRAPLTEWPEGALVVKDAWNGDALKVVAVMEKRIDGWFFAEYHEDGSVVASGRPGKCAGCHRTGDDFVRSFPFPN